ncbi:DUF2332 domain-containing protein [Sphingomonas gilva]|uniref:DUF2332 domain-containing protein n=1 Tax=Sphingomonas gilva TaxID=2305907 RepID=A0A396S582_9SPHN|nr:DUF2332 family protein [Sphingomonas gilva]RHW18575.1 DUF2332 domain-containing protein [Sphingomonas gilva]
MATEAENREAFSIQQFYCGRMAAPIYAAMCGALAKGLNRDSRTGARVLDWPGEPTLDAVPLRLMGGLHALVQAGRDETLAAIFRGDIDDPDAIEAGLQDVLVAHDDALMPWLDGPPQTNEPGRSGALILGLLEAARRHGPRIELLEIGSSAGLNLLIGRYAFDLGGVRIGPADSPITIAPEWRGEPPEPARLEFASVRGCDVRSLDATDPAVEARLAAYVWAETPARADRLRAAIAMQRAQSVDLVQADAAEWIEARLAEPQAEGVTRVLMHSVVWQYLPEATANRIRSAMAKAAAAATSDRALAWVMMEPDRAIAHQVVRIKSWPGHGDWEILATAHAHAAWVRPGLKDSDYRSYDLPESAKVNAG